VTDLKKYSNIKFHENPYSGSGVVKCGRTEKTDRYDEVIVAFRKFAKASKHLDQVVEIN